MKKLASFVPLTFEFAGGVGNGFIYAKEEDQVQTLARLPKGPSGVTVAH